MTPNFTKVLIACLWLLLVSCAPKSDDQQTPGPVLSCNDISAALSTGQITLDREVPCTCTAQDYNDANSKNVYGETDYHYTSDICAAAKHRNLLPADLTTTVSILPGKQCSYFKASTSGGVTSKEKDLAGTESSFYLKGSTADNSQPECNQKTAALTCASGEGKTWTVAGNQCTGTISSLGNQGSTETLTDSNGTSGSARFICQSGAWTLDSTFSATCNAADTTAPTLTTRVPAQNATNVAVGANIVLTFSENVKVGTGDIKIHKKSDDSVAKTISVTDNTQVTVNAMTVTINPTTNLSAETEYYVMIPSGAIQDLASNSFAGLTLKTDYVFKTRAAADTTAPTLTTKNPVDGATNVAVNSNIVMTFSENVKGLAGKIEIRKTSDDSVVASISANDTTQVTVADAIVTVNPAANLANSVSYYVKIGNDAIEDLAGNKFAGILVKTDYDFTTAAVADTTAPTLASSAPADNSTNVAISANLVLTFSESVKAGTGLIGIYKKTSTSSSLALAINVTDATQVSFAGAVMTVNPSANLENSANYFIKMAAGVVKDMAGNNYAGISDETKLNFSTIAADVTAPTLASSAPAKAATNVAINTDIKLTFSEKIKAGTGYIEIHKSSDKSLVKYALVTDTTQVTISDKVLTYNSSTNLAHNTSYYIIMAAGTVKDMSNNSFAGLLTETALSFKTIPADVAAPTITALLPADNAQNVPHNSNLEITFSENIKLGTGEILVLRKNDTLFKAISVTDTTQVSINAKKLIINPSNDFELGKEYYVKMAAGTVKDMANNNFAGISSKETFNFKISATDIVVPVISTMLPADDTQNVAVNANLVITFSENIKLSSGNIQIYKTSNNALIAAIPTSDTVQVQVSGKVLTINLTNNFAKNTEYYVKIDAGTIKDMANNSFAGLLNRTAYNFKTLP